MGDEGSIAHIARPTNLRTSPAQSMHSKAFDDLTQAGKRIPELQLVKGVESDQAQRVARLKHVLDLSSAVAERWESIAGHVYLSEQVARRIQDS